MEKTTKKILLSGYFGFGNIGDEAILEAEVQELRRQCPEVSLSVLCDNVERAAELKLTAYSRMELGRVIEALKANTLLLSGGGGLLQDSTGRGSVVYYGGLMFLARLLKRPTFMCCQGIGPLKTSLGRTLAGWFTSCATEAQVRDEESLKELQSIAPQLPVKLAADPVFLLQPASRQELEKLLQEQHIDLSIPSVVVAVRNWDGFQVDEFANVLIAFAKFLEESENCRIRYVCVPFQPSVDGPLAVQLSSRLGGQSCVWSHTSPSMLQALLGHPGVEMIVGMRLHSLIFAASQLQPFVGLSYDPKVARLCERCGARYMNLSAFTAADFISLLQSVWQDRQKMRVSLQEKIEPMRELARQAVARALELA